MEKQTAINELQSRIDALDNPNFDPSVWTNTTISLIKMIFVKSAADKINSLNEIDFIDPFVTDHYSEIQYLLRDKENAKQYIKTYIREIEIHGLEKERKNNSKIFSHWVVKSGLVSVVFMIGLNIGNSKFDKEKIDLENKNRLLRLENDSLRFATKFYPPIDSIKAFITSPVSKDSVNIEFQVKGEVQNFRQDIHHLWLVVNPRKASGWWPQISEIIPQNGKWKGDVRLGGHAKEYKIHIIRANKDAHSAFNNYLEQGSVNNDFPDKPLPDGAVSMHHISIIKR